MHYIQLRAFHAVATYGGFSKAANQLCLTQPAISDQVRKLEEHFGVLLFHRLKRTVRPTELGDELLHITRRMFDVESEAIELLSESKVLRTGYLNVAADAPLHAIQMISAFRHVYPGIEISLKRGNSDSILAQLHDYSADIGVLAQDPGDPSLTVVPLRRDLLVAFVPNDHVLTKKKTVSLRQLSEQPLVIREKGSTTRQRIEEAFESQGLQGRVVMIAEGREANREAVAAGIGIGIVSGPEFGHDSRLTALPISDLDVVMTEYMVYLNERVHQRVIKAFLDTVHKEVQLT
ncbi:MAG: LysR family transcriptional regulator [Magnetovibrio sp.]|nr:LysR family transcriptional regulator [Magnetovibrio sp.]